MADNQQSANAYLYEQPSPNHMIDSRYSPHLHLMSDQKNYEFENSEAPLDISRVENNFDDSAVHNANDLSEENSADILRDLNFV